LDLGVVLDNLRDGILSIEQACALFREMKEAAQCFFVDRMRAQFDELRTLVDRLQGDDDHDAFDLKGNAIRARFALARMRGDVRTECSIVMDSPPGRVLEAYWSLFGAADCVTLFPVIDQDLAEYFFKLKLFDALDSFTDEDLVRLRDVYRDKPMQQVVVNAQGSKLVPIANQLLGNPTEINQDVGKVKNRITEYKFSPDLNEVLEKVADGLAAGGDPFDQAALLKHLRTFFEKLHQQVAEKLRVERPDTNDRTDLGKCAQAIDFLQRKGVLTDKMASLGKALYGVLSNEGVHAMKSEREYVRLCRNQLVEYALVLFFELDRRIRR
jgi:hypothetical protein